MAVRNQADPEPRRLGTMTYAYLFKYIIIGDTGNPPVGRLRGLGRGPHLPNRAWGGGGAGRGEWAGRAELSGGGGASPGGGALSLPWTLCPRLGARGFPGGVSRAHRPLSGVGKSCLLLQFTDKRFQPVHDLTIGKHTPSF